MHGLQWVACRGTAECVRQKLENSSSNHNQSAIATKKGLSGPAVRWIESDGVMLTFQTAVERSKRLTLPFANHKRKLRPMLRNSEDDDCSYCSVVCRGTGGKC